MTTHQDKVIAALNEVDTDAGKLASEVYGKFNGNKAAFRIENAAGAKKLDKAVNLALDVAKTGRPLCSEEIDELKEGFQAAKEFLQKGAPAAAPTGEGPANPQGGAAAVAPNTNQGAPSPAPGPINPIDPKNNPQNPTTPTPAPVGTEVTFKDKLSDLGEKHLEAYAKCLERRANLNLDEAAKAQLGKEAEMHKRAATFIQKFVQYLDKRDTRLNGISTDETPVQKSLTSALEQTQDAFLKRLEGLLEGNLFQNQKASVAVQNDINQLYRNLADLYKQLDATLPKDKVRDIQFPGVTGSNFTGNNGSTNSGVGAGADNTDQADKVAERKAEQDKREKIQEQRQAEQKLNQEERQAQNDIEKLAKESYPEAFKNSNNNRRANGPVSGLFSLFNQRKTMTQTEAKNRAARTIASELGIQDVENKSWITLRTTIAKARIKPLESQEKTENSESPES